MCTLLPHAILNWLKLSSLLQLLPLFPPFEPYPLVQKDTIEVVGIAFSCLRSRFEPISDQIELRKRR
jgi:hypothetical protein